MKIKTAKRGEFTVIFLIGDMEVYGADELEGAAMALIDKGEKNIVVDFERLNYISSSGLRALINIRSRLIKEGGRLLLSSLRDNVLEVLRISKLIDIFQVRRDITDALK